MYMLCGEFQRKDWGVDPDEGMRYFGDSEEENDKDL